MQTGIGAEFIAKTRYRYLSPSPQQRGVPPPALEADLSRGGAVVDLPGPDSIASELRSLIEQRTSVREYSQGGISREELSYLLWCTQGVKQIAKPWYTLRTVPSAGARHAFESFVLVNNVAGLKRGLYWYRALRHKLEEFLMDDTVAERLVRSCFGQDFVAKSAVTFVWACDIERMTWRYSERGYRYVFIDIGHVCQNLYLAAESVGCGACAVAAFDDDAMNELLGLDGEDRFVIYVAAAGKKE